MTSFSIITINYNNYLGLLKTCNSIYPLLNKNIEWIVVDGLSNDKSVNFIRNNKKITHFTIEKDNGIYDAMNKGIDLATGDFIIFMNSGDTFHPTFSFNNIETILKGADTTSTILYGDTLRDLSPLFYFDKINDSKKYWWDKVTPCHQSIFLPRKFLNENKFDTNYKIFSDRKNMKLAFSTLHNHINLNTIISCYELGGISNIGGKNYTQMKEIINELISIDKKEKNINYILKLYLKFFLIKILGYKTYYSFMFFLKSIKK
ncbi:glycosyltransferase [Providencia rettgeri]